MAHVSSPARVDEWMNTPRHAKSRLIYTALLCCAFTAIVVWVSRAPGAAALPVFLIVNAAQILVAVWLVYRSTVEQTAIPFLFILLSAIALRIIGLAGAPLFEDDFYRYLFDGYVMATTGDPYSLPPSAFFANDTLPPAIEAALSAINYPDIATVYGPVSQWLFALAWHIAPGNIIALQIMAALADLAILALLATLCKTYLQRNLLLLYAWSPLLLKEFAITAHPDIYALLFGIAAICTLMKGRLVLTGMLLGLAVGAKVFALLLLPFVSLYPRRLRSFIVIGIAFVTTLVAITLSFGTPTIWVPEGLGAMAKHWLFNAPVYQAFTPILPFQILKIALLGIFMLAVAWLLVTRFLLSQPSAETLYRSLLAVWGMLLLCLPALNPWYAAWLLPFAVLYPARWPWIWSAVILLAYSTGFNTAGDVSADALHAVPPTLIWVQLLCVAGTWIVDCIRPLRDTTLLNPASFYGPGDARSHHSGNPQNNQES